VFAPIGDGDQIDAIAIAPGSSDRLRLQIKTGRLRKDGAIAFLTCTSNWRNMKRIQYDEIDFFAVYCPENGKSYLIPFEEAGKTAMKLRVDASANNQLSGVRWAKDYEIGREE
jgi:hypothetical protein